jgi:hypothetical protein
MPNPKTWLLAGAALALLAGTGAAVAQPKKEDKVPPRAETRVERHVHMRGDGAGPGPREGGRMMAMRHGDPAQHLRDVLQLRPEQEPALKAFVEATKGDHDQGRVRAERGEAKTTLDRLNDMEARMARHQAAMKTRIDATRTFYAQLDAKQKKAFDAMPMLMMGGPGMGPMGPMGMSHHMGHAMPMPPKPPGPPAPPEPPTPPPPPGA